LPKQGFATCGGVWGEIGRGIQVNEKMETSEPGVYACGDCAEYQGRWIPNWSSAISQVCGAGDAGHTVHGSIDAFGFHIVFKTHNKKAEPFWLFTLRDLSF
jgi:thioredoxin reductase